MLHVRASVAAFVLLGAILASGVWLQRVNLQPALASDCVPIRWTSLSESADWGEGCFNSDGRDIHFISASVNLATTDLVPLLLGHADSASNEQAGVRTMEELINSDRSDLPSILTSIGNPLDDLDASYRGFLRINKTLLAERELRSSFLSAIMCFNEAGRNPSSAGSRVIIFNAFEDGIPVNLNERLEDENNCPTAAQVGPRLIEYRGQPGIRRPSSNRQNWLFFSQGEGPEQRGYFTYFITPVDLFAAQSVFLDEDVFAEFDEDGTRVAVALSAGQTASLLIRDDDDVEAPGYRVFGQRDVAIPIALGVRP